MDAAWVRTNGIALPVSNHSLPVEVMLSFDVRNTTFQVRGAALILHQDHILLHRNVSDAYWTPPGGRVEAHEDAAATVVREMREELGAEVECRRLLHIAENFFSLDGRRYHEIGFYFLAAFPEGSELHDKRQCYQGIEPGQELQFRWFALSELASVAMRPTFLQRTLMEGAHCLTHEVQREP
jgi:ADP-ribose pyrophosphatase YjhB (NUDIX family)